MTVDIPERFYEQARSIRNGVIWESNGATRVIAEALHAASKEGAAEAEAENERLRKALEPFAKAGELFPGEDADFDQCFYKPAAGDGYALYGNHLRAARRALEGGE